MNENSLSSTSVSLRKGEMILTQGGLRTFLSIKSIQRSKIFRDSVVLTNQRLLVYGKTFFLKPKKLTEIDIDDIVSTSTEQSKHTFSGYYETTYSKYVQIFIKGKQTNLYLLISSSVDFNFVHDILINLQKLSVNIDSEFMEQYLQLQNDLSPIFDKINHIRSLQYICTTFMVPETVYVIKNSDFIVKTSLLQRVIGIWPLLVLIIAYLYLNSLGNSLLDKRNNSKSALGDLILGICVFILPIPILYRIVIGLLILLLPIMKNIITSLRKQQR